MPTDGGPADGGSAEGGAVPAPMPPGRLPHGIDPTSPNAARMYDYFLDGARNFAADRELADKLELAVPASRDGARVNRAFLRRAVQFMVGSGIRQFLDIGSGIPAVGSVHEIAQRADPECRIVYVDKQPVVQSELLLRGNDRAAAIQANLRDVEDVFGHPQTTRLLDLDRPIGLAPGLVGSAYWRPSGPDDLSGNADMNRVSYGGVGWKP